MTGGVESVPVVLVALTGHGMPKFRRDFSQRPKHEAEAQHIRSWQSDWRFVQDQLAVKQQIDIERSRQVSSRHTAPASGALDVLQLSMDVDRTQFAAESDNHVQEIIAIETERLASIHG